MQPTGSAVRALALAACAAGAALLLPGALQAQTPERPLLSLAGAPDDALSRRLADGRLTEAQYALERARSVFQLRRVRHAYGDVARPGRRDATLILRDLAARKRELSGPERELAEALLARPDDGDVPVGNGWTVAEAAGSPVCSALPGTGLCVHWVASSSDAPSPTDSSPANGVPDWIDLTLATWETVWTQEIGAIGYREPLPDGTLGDDNRLDVYVDDLGSDGVFGYCTSDDPNVDVPGVFAVWAYCVVDDDYAPGQYGSVHTPQEFLGVTSAHEFNHASQFAYDWLEDVWLLEGTATNIEETVYPNVNDNVVFLHGRSPLTRPQSPLDRGGFGDSEYGSWIFWRFLEETMAAGDPTIVREIWERADASGSAAFGDQYSLQAARTELAERGQVFPNVFARFVTANRLRDYDDAVTAGYPRPPLTARYKLGRAHQAVGWKAWRINHLAARIVRFAPRSTGRLNARLRIAVWEKSRDRRPLLANSRFTDRPAL